MVMFRRRWQAVLGLAASPLRPAFAGRATQAVAKICPSSARRLCTALRQGVHQRGILCNFPVWPIGGGSRCPVIENHHPQFREISTFIPPFREPTFQERAAPAAKAKQALLKKLRGKPPVDETLLAERRAARIAREQAEAIAREERLTAREQEKAARKARADAAVPPPSAVLTEAEKKAARDARYAARKSRAGKR